MFSYFARFNGNSWSLRYKRGQKDGVVSKIFFFTYFFQSSMYLTWEWKDADPVVSCVHVHRKYPVTYRR